MIKNGHSNKQDQNLTPQIQIDNDIDQAVSISKYRELKN
jgi:hypothetical protein